MKLIPMQIRELFHMIFLRNFSQKFAGRMFALKGGICLRFFYNSVRFSEDIDFDISKKIPIDTLSKNINNILKSQVIISNLLPYGITDIHFREVKRTETTQRWKVKLIMTDKTELSTKIELSKRKKEFPWISGIPSRELLLVYQITPFVSQYYNAIELAMQKIYALASDTRTVVRDLFDLHHLFFSCNVNVDEVKKEIKKYVLRDCIDKISIFRISDFQSEIIPFLPLDIAKYYSDKLHQDEMKNDCLEKLL